MYKFAGQKALVTGASKGLGKAIAEKLASQGCSVTLLARNEELLRKTVESLPLVTSGQTHQVLQFDLLSIVNEASKTNNNTRLATSLDGVSILVNCAGVTTKSLLPKLQNDETLSTLNLNLVAPIILSKLAYIPMLKMSRKLLKNGTEDSFQSPVILNISSVLSFTNKAVPGTSVYAASKAGLLGFTTALSAEFGGRVRVNALLPGLIPETEMGSASNIEAELGAVSLSKVVDKASEIIGNNKINGQCIICDNDSTEFFK
ncbi:3-oxoacyl-reductase [Scheffersomyces xylosifermentans]|uniref:3-oxoacyl-reductase n=1 Tax=Scheffersomyces xylosifermentans TaxID=1304137 RepID=UPI00315DAD46